MEGSLGFDRVAVGSQGLDIPESTVTSSERSVGFSAAYATPQSGFGNMSSSPRTGTPTSFHTADPMENDYQQEVISQVTESLPSTPGTDAPHPAFYSDGRPRPVRDGDEESHDSFEDGGYTTAVQIPSSHHFTDPDQPKLLLAEDPVPPLGEKQPLQDGLAHLPHAQGGHEELHSNHSSRKRKRRSQGETTPLLAEENQTDGSAREKEKDEAKGCCTIL